MFPNELHLYERKKAWSQFLYEKPSRPKNNTVRTYVSPIEKMGEKKKKMELFLIFVVVDDFNKAHMSSKIYAGEVHQSTS